jgi:hypothetical protein
MDINTNINWGIKELNKNFFINNLRGELNGIESTNK